MLKTVFLLFAVAFLAACQSTPNESATTSTTTPAQVSFPDTVFVHVDSTGKMTFGGKEIPDTDALKLAIADSLRSIQKQGGKVPALWYRTHGDVLMGMRGALQDVFMEVQAEVK